MNKIQILIPLALIIILSGCSPKNPRLPKGDPYKMISESMIGDDTLVVTYMYENSQVTEMIIDEDTIRHTYVDEGDYIVQLMIQGTGLREVASKSTKDGKEVLFYSMDELIGRSIIDGTTETYYMLSDGDTLDTYTSTIPDKSNPDFTFDSYGNITSGPGVKNTWFYK